MSHRKRWPTGTKTLRFGILSLGIIVLLIIIGPWLIPHDPLQQRPLMRLQAPNWAAWLGTDRYGRDLLTRLIHGGRITLLVSGLALSSVVAFGVGIGVAAGYLGGWINQLFQAVTSVLLAFPATILALVIVGLFGVGLGNVLIATISVWWVGFARVAHSITIAVKSEPVIEAARAIGAPHWAMIWREFLPRAIGPTIVLATLELGHLILMIAALSYLGLGAQPPSPEWGAMLADGRAFATRAPHLIIGPGVAVLLTVLALNCIGEGLRERLDHENRLLKGGPQ